MHRGIVRPSEVFAVQNYRTGVPVASNKAARYRTLAAPHSVKTECRGMSSWDAKKAWLAYLTMALMILESTKCRNRR